MRHLAHKFVHHGETTLHCTYLLLVFLKGGGGYSIAAGGLLLFVIASVFIKEK